MCTYPVQPAVCIIEGIHCHLQIRKETKEGKKRLLTDQWLTSR